MCSVEMATRGRCATLFPAVALVSTGTFNTESAKTMFTDIRKRNTLMFSLQIYSDLTRLIQVNFGLYNHKRLPDIDTYYCSLVLW